MRGTYTVAVKYSAFAAAGPFPLLVGSPKQGVPIEIVSAHITEAGSTTNQQLEAKIQEVNATWNSTNFAAVTPRPNEPNDQAAQSAWYAWGGSGASFFTLGFSHWQEGFSLLPGFHYTPVRDERLLIKAVNAQLTDGVALVMVPTPASVDLIALVSFREIG